MEKLIFFLSRCITNGSNYKENQKKTQKIWKEKRKQLFNEKVTGENVQTASEINEGYILNANE